MKWYDASERLPRVNTRVMVCREIRVCGVAIQAHDIGVLEGTDPSDRWTLESERYSPLPASPTLRSGIVTHWCRLPKLPEKKGGLE